MAHAVEGWFRENSRTTSLPDVVVVEWPRVYQRGGDRSRGDPNDLLLLSGVCVGLATLFPGSEVIEVEPREWKGQVPKKDAAGENPIERRVKARLTDAELGVLAVGEADIVKSLVHNLYDGVAIGLWGLGRFERKIGIVR